MLRRPPQLHAAERTSPVSIWGRNARLDCLRANLRFDVEGSLFFVYLPTYSSLLPMCSKLYLKFSFQNSRARSRVLQSVSGVLRPPEAGPCTSSSSPRATRRRRSSRRCSTRTGLRLDPSGSCQFLAKFRQNVPRFWLYRFRFLQENMRFAAFFKIY